MSESQHRVSAWGISLYLSIMYSILGIICYLTWQRSDMFSVAGWSWLNPQAENLQRILYAVCAGGLGSITYSFWKLYHWYCRKKEFDSIWTIWYVFGPISGSLLGIATYAVLMGGLLVLGETTTLRSNWAVFALSFLSGFTAKKALKKLHAIAEQVFHAEEPTPANQT